MFALAIDYGNLYCSAYTFSINTLIEKGPWAINEVLACHGIFSVQNKLFLLCTDQLIIVNLNQTTESQLTNLPCPYKMISYMPYSDNCTRVLLVSSKALYWLMLKEATIRLTLACELPGNFHINQVLNLGTHGPVATLLLHNFQGDSLVLQINLKSKQLQQYSDIANSSQKQTKHSLVGLIKQLSFCRSEPKISQFCSWIGGVFALLQYEDKTVLRKWKRGFVIEPLVKLNQSGVSKAFK